MGGKCAAYFLLLHELRIWYVVDDAFTKDRRRQDGVDFLGVHIFDLCIQDKLVAFGPKVDSDLPTKKNEGEDIAVLGNRC